MREDVPVVVLLQRRADAAVRDAAAFYREAEKIWRNPLLAPGRRRHPSRAGHACGSPSSPRASVSSGARRRTG